MAHTLNDETVAQLLRARDAAVTRRSTLIMLPVAAGALCNAEDGAEQVDLVSLLANLARDMTAQLSQSTRRACARLRLLRQLIVDLFQQALVALEENEPLVDVEWGGIHIEFGPQDVLLSLVAVVARDVLLSLVAAVAAHLLLEATSEEDTIAS